MKVQGLRYRVLRIGYGTYGAGFGIQGSGLKVKEFKFGVFTNCKGFRQGFLDKVEPKFDALYKLYLAGLEGLRFICLGPLTHSLPTL